MGRIRICQMITELRPAGAERVVYDLSRRLDASRFDVQVIALRGGKVAGQLEREGIKVTVLDVRGKWDVFKFRPLVEILRRERFDILHTHLFHADLVGRFAAHRVAVPHLIHTVHVAEARFRPWHFAFARFFSDWCEKIVCVSKSVYDFHSQRSGLTAEHYTVIPNGIAVDEFTRDEESRRRLRSQWGLSDDQPLAAFVGRLDEQKGIETLLGAMSHLGAQGNPVHLVIAGDGPKHRVVENFIRHGEGGGHCQSLGFVDDVRAVLSAADMLVMPSRWEGFGLAAAEAMAAGLPVVATRVAGIRDVVVDGETGLLVGCDDVVALSQAVEKLTENAELRKRLGQAGQKRIVENFSIDTTITAHEKLYTTVVGSQ